RGLGVLRRRDPGRRRAGRRRADRRELLPVHDHREGGVLMASGMVADFARMPTQRKVLVFVVIGTLIGLLYWKFAYKPLEEHLNPAEVDRDSNVAPSRRLAGDIPAYEQLRAHMTLLKELIEKNQTALPSAPELPAFFETVQHKVAESGVEIRKWTNRPEEPVESFIKVPADIEITGTFMQIK